MTNPIYEPIDEDLNRPATKADVEKILSAIEILYEQMNNLSNQ
ncbi:MAG: hypothetical protein WKF90_16605 [Pyrinomonadaceae bacterium]